MPVTPISCASWPTATPDGRSPLALAGVRQPGVPLTDSESSLRRVLASVLAVIVICTGVCISVLVSDAGEARATTARSSITCKTPFGALTEPAMTTGQFPASVNVKQTFALTDSGFRLTVTDATILHVGAGFVIGGKLMTKLAAKGAQPATRPITYTLKSATIPRPAPASFTVTAKGSTTRFKATKAGKISVGTTRSARLSLFLDGTTFGPYQCSTPQSPIATTIAH